MNHRLLALSLALLFGVLAVAQSPNQTTSTPGQSSGITIVQVIAGVPRTGMEAQFTEGRKRHLAWHQAQKDTWSWHAYEAISGEGTGTQLVVTSPHTWADMDARAQFMRDDQADVAKNILPYAGHTEISYWRVRSDMSRSGAPKPDNLAAPYLTVQHFLLNPDAMPAFVDQTKQISAALDKANAPGPQGLWYQLLNGGDGPQFVLVTPRKNWADFETKQSVDELLGTENATLLNSMRKGVKRVWSDALRHQDELSYHPAAATTH